MRLFIAIQLNEQLKHDLQNVQADLMRRGVRGNYTALENLHLTLAFIGDYPEPEYVLDAMNTITFSPFPIRLEGFGGFGDLWWAGLSQSEDLELLVRRLRHALSDAGIPFDRKRFSPHITLIRKASYSGKGILPSLRVSFSEMTVERVSLMRSDRGKHGMIYTELGCTPGL